MSLDHYPEKEKNLSAIFGKVIALGGAIGLTILVTIYREELIAYAYYGYAGIFVACVAANSTVFLPAPSSAIVTTFGYVYNPFWVAIAGGLGATVGEMVGYLAGWSGSLVVEKSKVGLKIQQWMEKHGTLAIFTFAFLPLPIFDLVGVISGATKVKLFSFLWPVTLGKILKMLIYAYFGAAFIPMIEPYIQTLLGK